MCLNFEKNDKRFRILFIKKIGKDINIKNCVLTVPAYFNQKQREATINSAKIIGLDVRTMVNEPTAASLAYAYNSLENADKKIVVIDLGGGTLDITLLRYRKDKEAIYCDIKFTYGNTNFGGEDFDNALMKKCMEQCINTSENKKIKMIL
jgi:molecular chaperone DnaK (HSP70)